MMSSINRWSLLFPINLRNDVLSLLRWRQILSQTELFSWLLSIFMNKFFILPPSWLTWTTREVADEGFLQTHRQWKVNDANTINVKFFCCAGKREIKGWLTVVSLLLEVKWRRRQYQLNSCSSAPSQPLFVGEKKLCSFITTIVKNCSTHFRNLFN